MSISVVYMTAGNMAEASRIAKTLVQQRLVACVNLIDGVRSIYEWEGTLQDEREVTMIAKTRSSRLVDLIATVKGMHSYACPCIVALPVSGGNDAFIDWISAQVEPPKAKDE